MRWNHNIKKRHGALGRIICRKGNTRFLLGRSWYKASFSSLLWCAVKLYTMMMCDWVTCNSSGHPSVICTWYEGYFWNDVRIKWVDSGCFKPNADVRCSDRVSPSFVKHPKKTAVVEWHACVFDIVVNVSVPAWFQGFEHRPIRRLSLMASMAW